MNQYFSDWNGDPSTLQNLTPNLSNIDSSLISALLNGLLLLAVVFAVFAIIAAFFAKRSLKELATHPGTESFTTVSLLLLIGALLAPILIGLLLIWIATLILSIAFYAMKNPTHTTTRQ